VARADEWTTIHSSYRIVLLGLGYVFDRLPKHRAAAFRPQLEAVLDGYRKFDPGLSNLEHTGVATRAIDLALHGREGYARSTSRTVFGPDRNFDAFGGSLYSEYRSPSDEPCMQDMMQEVCVCSPCYSC
jgi:hypothetical protein